MKIILNFGASTLNKEMMVDTLLIIYVIKMFNSHIFVILQLYDQSIPSTLKKVNKNSHDKQSLTDQ